MRISPESCPFAFRPFAMSLRYQTTAACDIPLPWRHMKIWASDRWHPRSPNRGPAAVSCFCKLPAHSFVALLLLLSLSSSVRTLLSQLWLPTPAHGPQPCMQASEPPRPSRADHLKVLSRALLVLVSDPQTPSLDLQARLLNMDHPQVPQVQAQVHDVGLVWSTKTRGRRVMKGMGQALAREILQVLCRQLRSSSPHISAHRASATFK